MKAADWTSALVEEDKMARHPPEISLFTGFAPAKVNLFLHVLGRRNDGYHDLESLVAFADIGDRLTLDPDAPLSLNVSGPFAAQCTADDSNLVLIAARAFQSLSPNLKTGAFHLEKNLPVAAGLGGGSADAAAALRLLAKANGISLDAPGWQKNAFQNSLPQKGGGLGWGLIEPMTPHLTSPLKEGRNISANLDESQLYQAALACGADVPVCLGSKPALMRGRGERVEPFDLPPLHAVLVNCGRGVSTKEVFTRLQLPSSSSPISHREADFIAWLKRHRNDLTDAALSICPQIPETLKALENQGAQLARMSGSGATVFGLFNTEEQAQEAAQNLAQQNPAWWVRAVRFHSTSACFAGRPSPSRAGCKRS